MVLPITLNFVGLIIQTTFIILHNEVFLRPPWKGTTINDLGVGQEEIKKKNSKALLQGKIPVSTPQSLMVDP